MTARLVTSHTGLSRLRKCPFHFSKLISGRALASRAMLITIAAAEHCPSRHSAATSRGASFHDGHATRTRRKTLTSSIARARRQRLIKFAER